MYCIPETNTNLNSLKNDENNFQENILATHTQIYILKPNSDT